MSINPYEMIAIIHKPYKMYAKINSYFDDSILV